MNFIEIAQMVVNSVISMHIIGIYLFNMYFDATVALNYINRCSRKRSLFGINLLDPVSKIAQYLFRKNNYKEWKYKKDTNN